MQAPGFWWQRRISYAAWLLMPVSWIYAAIATSRLSKPATRTSIPVICIGNFTAGGAGKTPTAIALCTILKGFGETPFFLSRGYGGTISAPTLVDPAHHSFAQIGDEPLLLSRHAPVIVARDRVAGAHLAAQKGASIIIMDDGMQNPSLAKDIVIAVVDGATGIGNGLTIPSGPLRLPMQRQWPLVNAVLVIGEGDAGKEVASIAQNMGKAVFQAALTPTASALQNLKHKPVLAFAGIGRPEKFFATLRDHGISIKKEISFPDHHAFTTKELADLVAMADQEGLILVTTEKDLVRISDPEIAKKCVPLPVELAVNSTDFQNYLTQILATSPAKKA